MNEFSVLMSVYKNEDPEYFHQSVESVINQSLKPNEIVLIRDGFVPKELQDEIDYYTTKYNDLFNYIPLEENKGLGNALKIGVENAKYDIIMRMDTDDIAVNNRFELQIKYFEEHPDVSILGGQINEFINSPKEVVSKRIVPEDNDEIKKFLKKRNAINHMTVGFRKQDIINVGNYQDFHYLEDYFLWLRLMQKNYKFANLPNVLVYARIGTEMFQRRGGYKLFLSCKKLENYKYKNKIINIYEHNYNLLIRFILQVLLTNKMREFIYKKFARE